MLTKSPDKDIWIVLFSISTQVLSLRSTLFRNTKYDCTKSDDHSKNIFKQFLSIKQQITLAEAAMIKYFKPHYNFEYKSIFPSQKHKSYNECYNLDFNAITFTIDTKELCARLYSKEVKKDFVHIGEFPFHSKEQAS